MPRKKKCKAEDELAKVGFAPNEKPKTKEEEEIERLLALGKVHAKNKG